MADPVLNRADPPEGSVFTATTDRRTAVTVLDNLLPGVLPADVENAYATVISSLDQLQSSIAAIVAAAHPSLVDKQSLGAIKTTMSGPINRLVTAGQAAARSNAEAFDRASTPTVAINEGLRNNYQASLLQTDATAIMQSLNKPDARIELIMAVLDTADMTGLPDEYLHSLRERLILINAASGLASNAAAEPTPQAPFATGVQPLKAEALARGMLDTHRAKVDALDGVSAAVTRLIVMLAVLSGASGPEVIWSAIRP